MEYNSTIILGKRNYGKSFWLKLITRKSRRFLIYDPLMSYKNIKWLESENAIIENLIDNDNVNFRYGIYDRNFLELFGTIALSLGNLDLAIEELTTVLNKRETLPEWFSDINFLGRHAAINLFVVAQRGASIPIDIRSQANRIVTFNQTEKADKDYIIDVFGRENVEDFIPELKTLECFDCYDNVVKNYSIEKEVQRYFPR